jgi:hypothetical protein
MIAATTLIEFQNARDLLERLFLDLRENRFFNESIDGLLYRGVSDSRYALVPTALRSDPKSVGKFKKACSRFAVK